MNQLEETVRGMIMQPDYALYTSGIDKLNRFSISTLAWSPEQQIDWKTKPVSATPQKRLNMQMFHGKTVHEFLERRFCEQDYQWNAEIFVTYSIPYEWKNYPFKEIVISGKIDLANDDKKEIIEIKWGANTSIPPHAIMQAGCYKALVELEMKVKYKCWILKLNDHIKTYQITDEEAAQAFKDIVERAKWVASQIDEQANFSEMKHNEPIQQVSQ